MSSARKFATCLAACLIVAAVQVLQPSPTIAATAAPTAPPSAMTLASVVGGDNALYVKQGAQSYQGLGGGLLAAPAVVAVPDATGVSQPLYIVLGGDHRLYVRSASAGWRSLVSENLQCNDNPAAAVTGTGPYTLTVVCVGGDQALHFWTATVSAGALPSITTVSQSLGGAAIAGPAVALVSGVITFFAEASNHYIYSRTAAGGSAYTQIPAACNGHPAAASSGTTAYLACQGLDGALYYSVNTGSGWAPFRGAGGQLIDGPGIAVTDTGVTIFVEGGDQGLFHTVVSLNGSSSSAFTADGGRIQDGAGAATVLVASTTPPPPPSGTPQPASGVILDGYGGLHPFGGATINGSGEPYSAGQDVARALVVLPDGSGGWMLDSTGAVHAIGLAPALTGYPSWSTDRARALVITPDHRGGYVLDGFGNVVPFGTAPTLGGFPTWASDIARGLDIHLSSQGAPDGGWTMDGYGGMHPFGAAPALTSAHVFNGYDVFKHLHVVAGGAYLQARWGIIDRIGAPGGISYAGMPTWGAWDIVRDVVPLNPAGAWTAPPESRAAEGALMDYVQSVDRTSRGLTAFAENQSLDAVSGNGAVYNTVSCGGPVNLLGDRTSDLYTRNYFSHAILGCSTTQYIFTTYLPAAGIAFQSAGENIAWLGGGTSLLDDAFQANSNWLASPEHYNNIVSPNFSQVGCGVFHAPSGSYQGATGAIWIWACAFIG